MVATHLKHYMSINNDISHLADTSLLATQPFVVDVIVTQRRAAMDGALSYYLHNHLPLRASKAVIGWVT